MLEERHNHYGSPLYVCNAMMDDHIALCVRRKKEGAGEHTHTHTHTLFFFRIERFATRERERVKERKENNYATTNVQSRSKRERKSL